LVDGWLNGFMMVGLMDLWMATPVNAAIAEAALLMHRCPGLEKFNIDISVVQRRIT